MLNGWREGKGRVVKQNRRILKKCFDKQNIGWSRKSLIFCELKLDLVQGCEDEPENVERFCQVTKSLLVQRS